MFVFFLKIPTPPLSTRTYTRVPYTSPFRSMGQAGLSANLMALAGLAIGIGMMVDGAVVMVENAFRIMAERLEHGEKVDRTSAVLAAAKEVATPIAFADRKSTRLNSSH